MKINNKIPNNDLWRLIVVKCGPAHTQTIHFAPTARKVVNLTGLLKTKGLNLIVKRANYENGPASK